jgi:site-specific DNA-methyltransferase (adenine-specific)
MQILNGNNLDLLKTLPDNSVDSIVTDPPYGLSFMNKKWDYDVPSVELWKEVYRVLKHGGHVLSFGGTRTYHRMVVNMEDAGFEIRDQIMWLYGSGFPKSLNIGKAVDKIMGNEREVVYEKEEAPAYRKNMEGTQNVSMSGKYTFNDITKGTSEWEGWGTALKPANEPICLARKPLSEKSVAENVLKYGTGGINIDGCRIEGIKRSPEFTTSLGEIHTSNSLIGQKSPRNNIDVNEGRFPANVIHDGSEEVLQGFPDNKGAFAPVKKGQKGFGGKIYGKYAQSGDDGKTFYNDGLGSASRFFYCAKASKKDRDEGLSNFEKNKSGSLNFRNPSLSGRSEDALSVAKMGGITESRANFHPTVKPTELMRYLCRLITPPNGIVLDPFMGSGSTGKGAILEGFDFIGMELDPEYVEIAKARIEYAQKEYSENQAQQKLF